MKKEEFFNKYYDPAGDKDIIMELVRRLDPLEAEHVMKTADEVLKHVFLFDMEWDMERTYEPVRFGDVIDWEYKPNDDEEFTWQFNRHRFLLCLGQAYLLTGQEKYAECFVDLILQFIRNQKIKTENRHTTWRILEIGIRSGNWIKAVYFIKNSKSLSEEVLEEIYESLCIHGNTIMEEHYPYCYAGNWGVLENHGLFLLGALLPQNEKTKRFLRHSVEVLNMALRMQILPDGMQLEQSPMYHNEILRCMLEVMLFSRKAGISLPEAFKENVHRMAAASLKLLKPNGHQFTMGDSDDMDMKPVMALAGYLFYEGQFKWMGKDQLTYDNLWLFSQEDVERYCKIEPVQPKFTSASLYDSGHYMMRSSWEEDADLLHFDGGLLGTSHGHSDTLHIDLIMNGTDVLIDPGRYTYVNKPERFYFKNSSAHNTILVDDKEFDEWENSWTSKTVSAHTKQKMIVKDHFEYVSAGHTGYMNLENPVFITRKVLHIKPDIYVIGDEMYTSGMHKYTQYFHFDGAGQISMEEERAVFQNGKTYASVFWDFRVQTELKKTKQSRHYNQMMENQTLCCTLESKGFQSLFTVIVKGNGNDVNVEKIPVRSFMNKCILPDHVAEGIKITYKKGVYLILMGHTDMTAPVDLYQIEDCMGCGNVIVFEPDKNKMIGNVLYW